MTRAPGFDDIFAVMAKASVGEKARVELPEDPDLEDTATRLSIALNLLLDDLAHQAEQARRSMALAAEAREQQRRFEVERLRETNRLKGRIINTSAHEFNTPLTPLRMNAQLLSGGTFGALNERQRQAVRVIERGLDRLTRLVRDMLDAAQLQDGKAPLKLERADLQAVLREAVEAFQEPARAAEVALELRAPPGPQLSMDVPRVHQVLTNLFANAVRATPPGGRITVEASREGDAAVVRVRDTGIGLTVEQVGMLFQPFSQVHPDTRREQAGTGLGLFICKGIVEQHGGRIACESEGTGTGSCFTFTLPLAPGSRGAP